MAGDPESVRKPRVDGGGSVEERKQVLEEERFKLEQERHARDGSWFNRLVVTNFAPLLALVGVVGAALLAELGVLFPGNTEPTAVITVNRGVGIVSDSAGIVVRQGTRVAFESFGSNDPDGPERTLRYEWKLSGAAPVTKTDFTHEFTNAGAYSVHLRVLDNKRFLFWDRSKSGTAVVDVNVVPDEAPVIELDLLPRIWSTRTHSDRPKLQLKERGQDEGIEIYRGADCIRLKAGRVRGISG